MTSYRDVHNYRMFGKLCKKCVFLREYNITCEKRQVQGREKKCKYFEEVKGCKYGAL